LLPKDWSDESEQILQKILAFATVESERVVNELQDQPGYCDLTPRQQAKAYAAAVGSEMPWSALLHAARKGKIDSDAARRLFKNAAEVQWLWANLTG
jgi:hypothetical protein